MLRRALLALVVALVALVALAPPARAAYAPPPLVGHVVDTTGALDDADTRALDARLEAIRRATGFEIVALVTALGDETIEDVAYTAFNTWGIGRKGADNGVLLVIAPAERRVRIETGKGVGGALTDLQSNDIIRGTIAPLLREGRLRDAIDQGASAIARTLTEGSPGGARPPPNAPPSSLKHKLGLGLLGLIVFLAIVSARFRAFLITLLIFGGRGGGGGGGGSGYRGGGGQSGGGGSSDSF